MKLALDFLLASFQIGLVNLLALASSYGREQSQRIALGKLCFGHAVATIDKDESYLRSRNTDPIDDFTCRYSIREFKLLLIKSVFS